ncbi:MAG: hypothetical protein HZA00_13870 [Nitrospinae bacterium]|nr:hypothetical protein [Nitrospinota bacterium]
MASVIKYVNATLGFVKENAPTMPDLYVQRIGLIVGFDPDKFPDAEHGEYTEDFKTKVLTAAKKILKIEKLELADIEPYMGN